MTELGSRRIRFGLFVLDRTSGELFRQGVQVPLQHQPLQVLLALLEQPDEVVTREELRQRLWQKDTFVDFDHGLNTAIKKLRAALGDSAENPRFVETLARRGYRFVAPVTSTDPASEPAGNAAPIATDLGRSPPARPRAAVAAIFAFIVVATSLGVWWIAQAPISPSADPGDASARIRVAVLPLRVISESGGNADEDLGVGIADAIITRLANVPGVSLPPTAAVLRYADPSPDTAAIARSLNAEHALVGTVQKTTAAYRVTLQLVRAADGGAIWARSYDMAHADLLRLQDNVAEQVVDALSVELTTLDRERLRRPHTTHPEAYEAYLRGRARLANYTEEKMRLAILDFEHALRLDPDYALARAALATAFAWFSVRYAYEPDAHEWGRQAEREAQVVLARDGDLADAHLALANAAGTLYGGFDWSTLIARSNRALALDPTLELAYLGRMRAFYHVGFFAAAREAAARARLVNPSPNVEIDRVVVAIDLFEGNFVAARDRALELLRRTDAPAVRNYLGLALYYLGEPARGKEMLASAKRGGRPDIRSQAALASVTAADDPRQARLILDSIEGSANIDHHVAYSIGATYAQLGMQRESLDWLERAAASGFGCWPWFANDPLLAPVRGEPAFTQLLDRLRATSLRFPQG